jgi:YHS domain-containing protein
LNFKRSGPRRLAGEKVMRNWLLCSHLAAAMVCGIALIVTIPKRAASHDGDSHAKRLSSKEALAQLNSLIGGWRGIGQPRRGSAAGSWKETAEWVWDFSQPAPAIRYVVTEGKILKTARLTFDEPSGTFRATATLADGATRDYTGVLTDTELMLSSKPDATGEVYKITVKRLNEKRTVVLFEKKRATSRGLSRIAEVGYTREGTRLAVEGGDGPECVVTGGKGTMAISYKGQTYYVCCSGCKQAFNENPEKILADYRARIAKRNADAK